MPIEDRQELLELINEEQESLKAEKEQLALLVLKKMVHQMPVIVEILLWKLGGAGGDEANIFAGDLFRMYSRYAERNNWRVEVIVLAPLKQGDLGNYF